MQFDLRKAAFSAGEKLLRDTQCRETSVSNVRSALRSKVQDLSFPPPPPRRQNCSPFPGMEARGSTEALPFRRKKQKAPMPPLLRDPRGEAGKLEEGGRFNSFRKPLDESVGKPGRCSDSAPAKAGRASASPGCTYLSYSERVRNMLATAAAAAPGKKGCARRTRSFRVRASTLVRRRLWPCQRKHPVSATTPHHACVNLDGVRLACLPANRAPKRELTMPSCNWPWEGSYEAGIG